MPTRIEDSTGKFIEATEDATEVLKGLVASLKGNVGKAKKIGKTGDSEDKLKDAVEKLPEEFVDELKKEFGDIGQMMKEVADFAKMMTKKREKATGLNNKDLNPMEKALVAIKKSSTDTYKTFAKKGSGYTHDIYVEAAIKSLNSLVVNLTNVLKSGGGGRSRRNKGGGGNSGGGNSDYDMLSGGSGGVNVGSSSDAAMFGVDAKDTVSELNELMTKMEGSMNRIHRNGRWWTSDLNQVAQYGAEISTEMERIQSDVSNTSRDYEHIVNKNEEISKYISEMSNNWDKLSVSQRIMMKRYLKEIKEISKSNTTIEEKSKQTVKLWKELGKEAKKYHIHAHSTSEILKGIAGHFKDIASSASGAVGMVSGFKFISGIFDGMGEGIKDWVKAGGQFRSLLTDQAWAGPGEYFNELFRVTSDTVSELGQAPNVIRKAWITNLKKGVRNMEDMKETTNSALAMAYHIGSNAESTSDEFQKWNMQLGLSGKQTAVLARNIKQTASDLGIMGDEMLRAVSSARELAAEMRNAGFDAEKAADGLIRMTGAAQKFGVEKQMNELASSMSGGLDSYMNASTEMKNLINQANQGQRVISGKAMSDPAEQKQSMQAVADMLKKEFASRGAVDAQGNIDTSKMTADQLSQLNVLLRRRFGKNMGVGESKRLVEAIEDANMTTDQKIAKLNSQMATNNNLTGAERKAMEEQLKILQEKKKQERNTQLVNALDKMREASAKGNPAEAMASMQKALNDQAKQAQARGIILSTDITTTTRESIDSVNERLKKAGKTELKRDDLMRRFETARAKNDIAGIRSIQEEISKGSALADTGMKENSNVADKMEMAQNKLQASIQSALGNITMLLGALPVMVLILGAIAASLLGLVKFGAILKSIGVDSNKIKDYWKNYWGIASKGNSVHTRDNLGRAVLNKILHQLKMLSRSGMSTGKTGKGSGETKLTSAEKRKMKNDEKNRAHGKAQRKHDQKGMAAAKAAKGSGKGGGLLDLIEEKLAMPSFELPKNMKKMATDMIKGAVGIALIAAGVIALAAVVLKLGQGILAITGLNTEKALEIGKSVMAVLIAAGLIAVACIAAAYGLKQLNDARKNINVKDVYTGAGFLLILTPAMMLMAIAIIAMGQVMSSMISMSEAKKIAEGVAAIMMSAAIIALAVVTSAAVMGGLGALLLSLSGPQGLFIAGAMLAGAAALLILTPAMIGMALAIIGIASGVSSGIDINWARTTSENVASIMMSAGIIALSVLLMAGSCTVLGLLYPFAPKLAMFMLLGAGALMILTPAMIALAAVIIDIANKASQKIDVNKSKETANNVADIMMAAAKIATAVVLMATSMTILGALSLFAPTLVGFMYLGAGALMILTPAVIKLAAAIIDMAGKMMVTVDPKKGVEVAKSLADFMTSTRSIVNEILEMSAVAGLLGALFTTAVFIAFSMMLGSASISILGSALVFFGKRVMGVGEELASEVNMAKMEDARKAMENMAAMGAAFSKTIDSLQNNILPLVSKPFLGLFGRSVADKLAEAIIMFSGEGGLIERVVQFFTAIRDGFATFAADQGVIENSIKSIEKMNELIPKITAFLSDLGGKLEPLTGGWWWDSPLKSLGSKIESFGAFFRGIGWALYYGMIYPIKAFFPGEQETAQMLVQIDNMSKLMDKVNVSLNQLSAVMNAWITEDWWNSPLRTLRNKTRDFGYFFSGIGWAIRFGMINPIRDSFPAISEMDEMNAFLSAFTDSLNQLATTLDALNSVTQSLSGTNIDIDKINQLQNIAARIANPKNSGMGISISGGGGETAMNPMFDWISDLTNNTEVQSKKEDSWWSKMLGVLTGVGSPQTSTAGGFGKIMRGSMDTSVGAPINKMGRGISKINDQDATLGDIIRTGDKTIVDAINSANSAIVAAIYASNVIVNVTVDKDKTTTTVNRASASSAAAIKGNATSGNISDMDDRVAAKVGSSRPPAAMQAANEELIKISANTEKLVLIADEQLSRLDEIIESLKVDSSPAPGGDESTMLNTKPRSTPNYYTWRQGRYGDTPVKQYVNPGT